MPIDGTATAANGLRIGRMGFRPQEYLSKRLFDSRETPSRLSDNGKTVTTGGTSPKEGLSSSSNFPLATPHLASGRASRERSDQSSPDRLWAEARDRVRADDAPPVALSERIGPDGVAVPSGPGVAARGQSGKCSASKRRNRENDLRNLIPVSALEDAVARIGRVGGTGGVSAVQVSKRSGPRAARASATSRVVAQSAGGEEVLDTHHIRHASLSSGSS